MSIRDERACADIVLGIADALDTCDVRLLGELLRYAHWDVEATGCRFSGTRGAEQLVHDRALIDSGRPTRQHDVSNVMVSVTGEGRATARSEFAVVEGGPRVPLRFVLAGGYDDEFTFLYGRWRLSARVERWELVAAAWSRTGR